MSDFSAEYWDKISQNRLLHQGGKAHRGRTIRYYEYLKQITETCCISSVLDYGCGRAHQWRVPIMALKETPMLKDYLGVSNVTCYDPAVAEFSELPPEQPFDLVICTDVLSLIPSLDLPLVFQQIHKRCGQAVFFVVQSDIERSNKKYPDGSLKQVTIKSRQWWLETLQSSADWTSKKIYWKWAEDGRITKEKLTPLDL